MEEMRFEPSLSDNKAYILKTSLHSERWIYFLAYESIFNAEAPS